MNIMGLNKCVNCSCDFSGRTDAKFCSISCKAKWHRKQKIAEQRRLYIDPYDVLYIAKLLETFCLEHGEGNAVAEKYIRLLGDRFDREKMDLRRGITLEDRLILMRKNIEMSKTFL